MAHHAGLTRLLIERGADPNDDEVVYHSPEGYDLAALKVIVETGRVTPGNLVMMLVRKHDWHDCEGVKYLLRQGADPNRSRSRGLVPILHAIARDNDLPIIELLLDHGADMNARHPIHGITATEMAARRGRSDILEALPRRGIPVNLTGVNRLIAACAMRDTEQARALAAAEPGLVTPLLADGGRLIAEFAGNDNTGGVRCLLDLGVPVDALFADGDGYWDEAPNSTALHVAAWRASHDTARLLIERGANVNAKDGKGRPSLQRAVKACVDSYWTEHRKPDTVSVLLRAGASVDGVPCPSGYDEVDSLLAAAGARPGEGS